MPTTNRLQTPRRTISLTLLKSVACAALLGIISTTVAMAQPATADGAQKLVEAFQAYIGAEPFEKGILSISPHGDAYDLKFAFDSSKLDLPPDEGIARIDPYVVRLRPQSEGTWAVDSDPAPFTVSWAQAAQTPDATLQVSFANCAIGGLFDARLLAFPKLSTKCGNASLKARSPDADVDITSGALSIDSTGKADGPGNADLQFDLNLASVTGKIADRTTGPQPMPISFRIGGFHESVKTNGARLSAVTDLVSLLKANASREQLTLVQSELKAKLRAALPFWEDLSIVTQFDDLAADTPFGSAKLAHIEQREAFTGVVKDARYADGLRYSGLELPAALGPEWARSLIPAEAGYATKLSLTGLDAMADVLIRGVDTAQDPPFTKLMGVALVTRLFSSQPQYDIDLSASAPAYSLQGKGHATLMPEPKAGISLSTQGFDAIAAALGKADDPEIQKAMFALAFAKGLAKSSADGTLTWDVSYDIVTNRVVVNDQSFALPNPN